MQLRRPDAENLAGETELLVTTLGDPEPALRADAATILLQWTASGVYDDLLAGFGDGISAALSVSVTDPVRREASARVLTACVARDQAATLVLPVKVLEWSDRLLAWVDTLRGDDSLGATPVLSTLTGSRHFGAPELRVLLDVVAVVADRPCSRQQDRAEALADVVTEIWSGPGGRGDHPGDRLTIVTQWLEALTDAEGTRSVTPGIRHLLHTCFTRASLRPGTTADRAEAVLAFVEALRRSDPERLGAG